MYQFWLSERRPGINPLVKGGVNPAVLPPAHKVARVKLAFSTTWTFTPVYSSTIYEPPTSVVDIIDGYILVIIDGVASIYHRLP